MADGMGCRCYAYSQYECGCGVDWTPSELIEARERIKQLTAERDALKAALELLYSWANNWDSEFMNDPDWKNRDVLIVQEALKGLK